MSEDRERGIVLRLLDREKVNAHALAHLRASYPDEDWVSASVDMDYAVYLTTDFRAYVICTEGVGWEVRAGKPLSLLVAPRWRDEDSKESASITATTEVALTQGEVRMLASEETVDLADFVRSFGARLESNFWLWHGRLTEEMAS